MEQNETIPHFTAQQNKAISQAMAEAAIKLCLEEDMSSRLANIYNDLTAYFLMINAKTDFRSTPPEIPSEWLEEAKKRISVNLVEKLLRSGAL